MNQIPVIAFEIILSHLNTIDKHNAIIAFNVNCSSLVTTLTSKIYLALEYRFHENMMNALIVDRSAYIKELDLTGIFWIPKEMILKSCSQLPNVQCLYLLGTSVTIDRTFKELQGLQKIKYVAVAVNLGQFKRVSYCLLERKLIDSTNKIDFNYIINVHILDNCQIGIPVVAENWLTLIKPQATEETLSQDWRKLYKVLHYSDFLLEGEPLNQFISKLQHENTIIIEEEFGPFVTEQVSIEPIKHLKHLTELYIDVHEILSKTFLKPVFQSCLQLKKLSIICHLTSFQTEDLKYAPASLEDLSVDVASSPSFYFKEFFESICSSRASLRRFSLVFDETSPDEDGNFKWDVNETQVGKFMQQNPHLIFVWIICMDMDVDEKITAIARLLKTFKKEPHQLFVFKGGYYERDNLPLPHWDMMNMRVGFLSEV